VLTIPPPWSQISYGCHFVRGLKTAGEKRLKMLVFTAPTTKRNGEVKSTGSSKKPRLNLERRPPSSSRASRLSTHLTLGIGLELTVKSAGPELQPCQAHTRALKKIELRNGANEKFRERTGFHHDEVLSRSRDKTINAEKQRKTIVRTFVSSYFRVPDCAT
jgi:hypothetical protein